MIIDERARDAYGGAYPIPLDPKTPYLISGGTLAELSDNVRARLESLASKTGGAHLSPGFAQNLAETVQRFNEYARAGRDPEFGRGAQSYDREWQGYFSVMREGSKQKPNDPEIMGSLAGINLKANDWRKSIEWYLKVAQISTDTSSKVAAYQFIGNVAWSKLNSRTLTREESVELADRGIGALQHAAELQPDNPKPVGLMASIFNFRGQAQGPAWAALADRASAQDLQHASRVLNEKAKKAAGQATPAPVPTGANPPPAGTKTGG